MTAVLLTDGDQRAALAAARSLGKAGYTVHVTGPTAHSLAGSSRYATGTAVVPDALTDTGGFTETIRQLVARRNVQVVLPITEAALLAILSSPGDFADVNVPFCDLETFRRISDKQAVLAAAPAVGIRVPHQRVIASAGEAAQLDVTALRYPLVAKPARSVGKADGRMMKVGVAHAADAAGLAVLLRDLPPQAFPLMLQQRIVGPGIGVFLLVRKGQTLAAFSHRRIREKPPSGGVSVYRESIPLEADLFERSRALLDAFNWDGVAMVEYKLDHATGSPYLMEINGRLWGSLQLAIDAGVDFPRLMVETALGREVTPVTRYRTGIRSRWWWGDVDHLLLRLFRSSARLALPPGTPGRLDALLNFLKLWRPGDRNEVMRFSDPVPFIWESWRWLRGQ